MVDSNQKEVPQSSLKLWGIHPVGDIKQSPLLHLIAPKKSRLWLFYVVFVVVVVVVVALVFLFFFSGGGIGAHKTPVLRLE